MIIELIEKWNKNKNKLEKYFERTEQNKYSEYADIFKTLFDYVINDEDEYEINGKIDDGSYQGTMLFIFHNKSKLYITERDYIVTYVDYGLCSVCDTLQSIQESNYNEKPTKEQVEDYITLCLHLLQNCEYVYERR